MCLVVRLPHYSRPISPAKTPRSRINHFFFRSFPPLFPPVPLCSNVLPSQSPINHPQLIHTNPQLLPNSLPSANYVATKYVPINILKPNDITTSHPNLSITESSAASGIASSASHQPVRNYAKILPKSNPNLVKLGTPIPFLQNHYLIPTTVSILI